MIGKFDGDWVVYLSKEYSKFINYLKKPRKPLKKMIYCYHTRTSCRNTRHCCCFMRTYSSRSLCCHITENTFRGMSFMVHWCLRWLTIVIMVLVYLMLWFIMEERCCCHYENIPIIMKDRLAFGKTCYIYMATNQVCFGDMIFHDYRVSIHITKASIVSVKPCLAHGFMTSHLFLAHYIAASQKVKVYPRQKWR